MRDKYIDPLTVIFKLWILALIIAAAVKVCQAETEPQIISNLINLESRWKPWISNRRGGRTSYGLFQITEPVLMDYNTNRHTFPKYTIRDLFDTNRAGHVFFWHWTRLKRIFKTNYFEVVNAYNMGISNTYHNRQFFLWYIREIMPEDYRQFKRHYIIVKHIQGTRKYIVRRRSHGLR